MPRDCANALFVSGGSTLTAKYAASNDRMSSPLSRSDRHSAVQGPVNAFANHASTTACLPLELASVYVAPSDPGSENCGAESPTFNRPAIGGVRASEAFRGSDAGSLPARHATEGTVTSGRHTAISV